MYIGASISYLASLIFIGMGFHKMYAYSNEGWSSRVNAYVAGDAYNLIINANYATALFVLAVFCAVIGMTFIMAAMLQNKNNASNAEMVFSDQAVSK